MTMMTTTQKVMEIDCSHMLWWRGWLLGTRVASEWTGKVVEAVT